MPKQVASRNSSRQLISFEHIILPGNSGGRVHVKLMQRRDRSELLSVYLTVNVQSVNCVSHLTTETWSFPDFGGNSLKCNNYTGHSLFATNNHTFQSMSVRVMGQKLVNRLNLIYVAFKGAISQQSTDWKNYEKFALLHLYLCCKHGWNRNCGNLSHSSKLVHIHPRGSHSTWIQGCVNFNLSSKALRKTDLDLRKGLSR